MRVVCDHANSACCSMHSSNAVSWELQCVGPPLHWYVLLSVGREAQCEIDSLWLSLELNRVR